MVAVKICGITEYEDASTAGKLGAAALGFIFASSPRQISPEKAGKIIRKLPPFVKSVGVFVNEALSEIRAIIDLCCLDLVQLHGDESPELCSELMPYTIKVFRVKDESILDSIPQYHGKVRALLLDTYQKDKPGGTGKTFDWELAKRIKTLGMPIILSGGLGPTNIESAISIVRPYAVDVSSGVEEHPGKKNHRLLKEFFTKVHRIQPRPVTS